MIDALVRWARSQGEDIHYVVFPAAALLILAFVLAGVVFTASTEEVLSTALETVTERLGWFFIMSVTAMLIFAAWLATSRYGGVRLGPDDSRPDYSYVTWFAMLFSAGMGIGLVFWGVAEPISHFAAAPREAPQSSAAAKDAMLLTFNHWGLGPWAVYAILGLSLGYFGYRHGLPLSVRSALYPLIGERIHGWPGNLVDVLAVLGTMFGVATSLGLGVMQINAGLGRVFDVSVATNIQVWLIAGITIIATVSVFTGVDTGIRRLSEANLIVAGLLVAFVAALGPTLMLVSAYVENVGNYVTGLPGVLFWSGTYEGAGWLADWTIFYWAWWISWSPFVGMFIARISRGRTIREFVLGVLLVPALVSFAWFTVFGNTALDMELTGTADIIGPTAAGAEFALFALLEEFPLTEVSALVAVVVIVVFFVTSSDSGSFVIEMLASGGNPDPPRLHRVFWAVSEGFVSIALLLAGGLAALQAGAVSTGLPFTFVLLVVMLGLAKALRAEREGVALQDMPDYPLIGRRRIPEAREPGKALD